MLIVNDEQRLRAGIRSLSKRCSYCCKALAACVYLSMILGANFESESGPAILLNVSLIIRFGGHVTIKKRTT